MIIVDAYNCLHAASAMRGPLTGLSLRQLCILAADSGDKVLLVMDGMPKPDEPAAEEFPDIGLRYSGRSAKADDLIAQILQKSTGRRETIVVSNDRQVSTQAKKVGAQSISCERFIGSLATAQKKRRQNKMPSAKTGHSSSRNETDFWLKEFGIRAPEPKKVPDKKSDDINPDDINMEDFL
jgi:predicted RNA-binding protein with PIN domain